MFLILGAAGSPYNPQTPGSSVDIGGSGLLGSEWCTTDIEIRIRDSHPDLGLSGQTGIIRGISVSSTPLQGFATGQKILKSQEN